MTDAADSTAAAHPRSLPTEVDTVLQEDDRLELGAVQRLRVHVARGQVDVIGRDEPGATVEAHEAARPLPVRLDDGVLRIGSTDALALGGKAVLTITVQRDAAVEVDGTSASVLISGMKQGLLVRTVSGDVVGDATAGTARLEGVSAELALREHEGRVDVTTISGAATVSGAITRLEHTGVSGEVFLDLEAPDRVEVRTVSGPVVLRLGRDRSADYAVDTVSGEVQLDGAERPKRPGGVRGRWDGPGEPTAVRVSTSSGSVRIVHAEET